MLTQGRHRLATDQRLAGSDGAHRVFGQRPGASNVARDMGAPDRERPTLPRAYEDTVPLPGGDSVTVTEVFPTGIAPHYGVLDDDALRLRIATLVRPGVHLYARVPE